MTWWDEEDDWLPLPEPVVRPVKKTMKRFSEELPDLMNNQV